MYETLLKVTSFFILSALLPTGGPHLEMKYQKLHNWQALELQGLLIFNIIYNNIIYYTKKEITTASECLHHCCFWQIKAISTAEIIPLAISGNDCRLRFMYSRQHGITTCNSCLMSVIDKPYVQWAAVHILI